MARLATHSGRKTNTAVAMTLHLAVLGLLGSSLVLTSPAVAQMNTTVGSSEATAAAKTNVADALSFGRRVLLVELHGSTLYVFNASNNVGGPVLRVLEGLGFISVLPSGVSIGGSGVTALSIDQLQQASADHVFFLNFSTAEETVRDAEEALRRVSQGRLYRLDTTTSVALSDDWTESYLAERVASAIRAGG